MFPVLGKLLAILKYTARSCILGACREPLKAVVVGALGRLPLALCTDWGGWGTALRICLYLKDIFPQPVYAMSQRVDVLSDQGGLTFGVKPT